MSRSIQIEPDDLAVLADRLVRRIVRDGLAPAPSSRSKAQSLAALAEAIADELHRDIIDRMLGRSGS